MSLFLVSPNAKPPVYRIGKQQELVAGQAKKERDAKRRQLDQRRATIMKEVSKLNFFTLLMMMDVRST